ncbi:putative lipoprotein [Leptospira inadai serovar Lyme str. 10]|uniref:Lipoprotein n=2 Tax=Leptospira inadai serovar Lyme TaxID=293084 RepID=A0ABX4YHB3_9LEPT|nr:hypothetical protein [Leptospira inadai]EQA36731.1 putative lipoprotein [Leptospira inadai serovar Lyme str. 10]PNV74646.1 hypothetical protein BES34_012990 [Leptospira inadai serovar Lyme]
MKFHLLGLLCIFAFSCGVKPVPPPTGTFCDPLKKERECILLDFRNGKTVFEEKEYSLKSSSILNYSFTAVDITYEIEVLNENRVKIIGTDGSQKLFLRLKDKGERKREWARLWQVIKEGLGLK